jgi:hypothetical protein
LALKVLTYIIVAIFIVGLGAEISKQYQEITELEKALSKKQSEITSCEKKDIKIKCMEKTLLTTYQVSKWEAHYYSIIFNDFSEHYNIPWEIYPAIIRVESNFKTDLKSSSDAKGIMQVLESTGKGVAQKIGIDFIENSSLWNEIVNISIGCTYLSTNIEQKGLEKGVQCYLGGPDYLKTVKADAKKKQYVSEYKTTVWKEFNQLLFIYKGIITEAGEKYEDMHVFYDTPKINTELFKNDTIKTIIKDSSNSLKLFIDTSNTIGNTNGHK